MRARSLSTVLLLASTVLIASSSIASETITYTYDALGRLVQVGSSGTINNGLSSAYSYDPAGNRSNLTVTGSTGGPYFSVSDASGTEGGPVVFTITKSGSTTSSFVVDYATSSGTALSGTDFNPVSTSVTFAPADTSKTVSVSTIDDAIVEGSETFQLTISGAAGAVINDAQGIGTIIDNDLPPPSFAIGDASVAEGGNLVFTVTKTGTTSSSFSVNYASANGTATAGSDYTAVSNTLTFLAADTTKIITVTTIDDAAVEGNETVLVNLSGATGGATISDAQGVGTIIDNDTPPPCASISFTIASNGAVTEGANSGFTVTKSGTTTNSCSVNYATANGTAVAPGDYTAKSGTLTFTSAQTSQTVSVTTIDDTTVESAETFTMSLSSPTGGSSLGTPSSATATINDNDTANQPPVANPDSMTVKICESGTKNVTANDTDPNGDSIFLTNVTSSALVDAYVLDTATVGVTAFGATGNTQVTYTISDGHGGTANGILAITVLNGTGCMFAPPSDPESTSDPAPETSDSGQLSAAEGGR